jgi:hypothetical protein
MDGHERCPGTYFRGWTPSCHLYDLHRMDAVHAARSTLIVMPMTISITYACFNSGVAASMINKKYCLTYCKKFRRSYRRERPGEGRGE